MNWCLNLSGEEIEYLVIDFFDFKYVVIQHCLIIGDVGPTLPYFPKV
jgi:hypothetical protein